MLMKSYMYMFICLYTPCMMFLIGNLGGKDGRSEFDSSTTFGNVEE